MDEISFVISYKPFKNFHINPKNTVNVACSSVLKFNFVAVVFDVHRVVLSKHYLSHECLNSVLKESGCQQYIVAYKLVKRGINIFFQEI